MTARTNGRASAPSGVTLLMFPGTVHTDRDIAQAHALMAIPTSPVLTDCIVRHARILAELDTVAAEILRRETCSDARRDTLEGETLWQTETGVAELYAHQKRLFERLDEATFDIIRCNAYTLRDVRAQAAYLWVHIGWRSEEVRGTFTLPILEALGVVDDDASVYKAMSRDERTARYEAIDELIDRYIGDAVDLETQSRWLDATAFYAWAQALSGADMRKGGAA